MQPLLKSAPARMTILDYGLFQVHEDKRVIGICGYLIQTMTGENVLIDTGFPAKYAKDPIAATAEDELGSFGKVLSLTEENLAPAQLALSGLEAKDIHLMIQSHSHIDHIGFMDSFPGVPILIAETERALSRPLYWSAKRTMEWPEADYRTIAQDTLIGPDFEVLLVPGHAPGQLAFSLKLPNMGSIMLTSDAVSRASEIEAGFEGCWDASLAVHHAKRLLSRAERDQATLIYGHCPEQWGSLRKAPAFYD